MIRYTTPTITLNIRNFTLPDECDVYVTFKQGSTELTLTDISTESSTNTTLSVTLTQEQTGSFKMNAPVQVQVNWITRAGTRFATKIAQISAFENLLDKVIAYGS